MVHVNALVNETNILLSPDHSRVVLRRFDPNPESRIPSIIKRIDSLSDKDIANDLKMIRTHFSKRHIQIEDSMLAHFESVKPFIQTNETISEERKLLIGAYFTNEYTFESTALFNPSIVLHPDQSDLPIGSIRFIMSLRATGEGHISSLTFRTGVIDASSTMTIDPVSQHAAVTKLVLDSSYDKATFGYKLAEMGFNNDFSRSVLDLLQSSFTINQLKESLFTVVSQVQHYSENDKFIHDQILSLALSNYEVTVSDDQPLSYWVIFPTSPSERNGIEDARFVRFIDDDGSIRYYATYTAYDGRAITPQLIETDFKRFKMITLNGSTIKNKGMALFPRRINGKYAMLGRQDNDSIFLMYSENIHFWNEAVCIAQPKYDWEFMQIGNCGSPVETKHGWLVLTHGVGPLRQYSIGVILFDLNDPTKIIGRLKEPLIVPTGKFRNGYVPNVVYTCGCLVHNDKLIVPYALSDLKTTVGVIDLPKLLQMMVSNA